MLGRYMIEQLNELRLKNVQCDLELVSSDNRTFNMHQIVFTALNQKHFHLAVQQACIYSSDIILSKKKMYLSQLSSSELELLIEFMYGATFTTKRMYDILLSALGKLDMLYLLDMIGGFTLDNDSPIKTETITNTNISNETMDQATQDTNIQPRNELGTNTEPVDNIFTNIHVESNDLTSDVGSIKEEPVSPVSTPVIVTVSKPSTAPQCNPETDEHRHEELRNIRKDLFSVCDAVNDSMLQELKTEIETDKEIVGVDVDEIERVYQNFKQSVMSEKLNGTKHSFTDQNPTNETPAVPRVTVTNTSIENDFNENVVIDVQLDPTTKSSTIRCINTVQYPPKDLCVKNSCEKQLDVPDNDSILLSKTSTVPPHCATSTVKPSTVKPSTVNSSTVESSTVKSPTVKSSIQSTAVLHTYILPKRSVLLINSCAPSLSAGNACTTSNTLSSQASTSITQQKLPTVVNVAKNDKSNKNLRSSMGKHDKVFLPNNGVLDQSQVSRNKATPIACSIFSVSKESCAPSNCASFSRTTTGTTSVSVTNQQIFAPKIYAVNSHSSLQVLQQSISLRRSDGVTTSEDIKTMFIGRQNFQNTDSMTSEHMVDTKIGDPKPKIQQKSKLMKRKITSKQVKAKNQAHERYGTQHNLTMTENQCDNDKFKVMVNDPVYGDPSSVVRPAGSETETGSEYDNDILQTEQSSSDVPNQPEFTMNESQCAYDMSDGATPESAQSSFEFSHKTFQTESGNTIMQAEISNETAQLETGKKTNQSEFGNETTLPKTGNETIQSETGNETILSETGYEAIQSDTGDETILLESGDETILLESGDETILLESGNETNQSETSNETTKSETGNETISSKTGNETSHSETDYVVIQSETSNETNQSETGNETNQSETSNETNQSETGNETILSQTGNATNLSETGDETNLSETGNETNQSQTGNETNLSETGNETNQSQTGNATNLSETGDETNLSETGNETNLSETGNKTILSQTGNATNLSETGDETNLSETGNETNQSQTGDATNLSETGDETNQSETGNETNQSETGNETNQSQTGNATNLSETGDETNLSETGNETNLSETGNKTILYETGNKTNLSETGDETILSKTGNETILSETCNETIQSETGDETILSETDKGFVFEQIVLADPNGTIEPIVTTSITQCTSSISTSSITSSSTSLTTGQYMTLRSKQSPKVHKNSLISDERGTHSSKLDTSMCKVVLHDYYKQSIVSAKETPVCNNSYFGKKDKMKKQLRKPLFKKSSKQNDRSKAVAALTDEHNAKCKNTVYSQMKDLDFIKIDGTLPTNLAECDVLTENATAFLKEPIQNVVTSSKSLVYSQSNKQVINFGDVGSVDNIVKDKPIERVNSCENAEKSKVVASFRKSIGFNMPSSEYGNFSMSGFTDQRVENEFIVLDEVSNLPVDYTSLNNNLFNEETPSKSSSDSCIVPLSEILSLTPAQLVKNYQTIVEKSKQKNETIKLPRSGEKGASKSPAFKTFDRTFRRTKSKSNIFEKTSDCQLFKNDQTMIEKSRKRKSISPIEDIENDIMVSAGKMKSVKADGQKNPKSGNSEPGTDRQLVKKYKTLAEILGKTTTNVNHVECTAGCQNKNIEKSSSVSTVITQAVYSGNSKYVNVTLNSTCTVSSAISGMPPVNVSPGQNLTGRGAPSPVAQPKVPATVIRFPVRILGHTFQSAKPVVQQEQSTITFSSTSPICSYTTVSKSCAEHINNSRKRWKSTPAFSTKEGKKRKLLNCNEKGDFHSLVVDSNPDKSVALENCTGTAEQNVHVDYNQDVQEIIVDIVENSEEVDIKRNVDPPSSHLRVALFAETESNHGEHGIKQTHRNVRQLNEVINSNSVEPGEGDSVLVISTDDHMTGHVSDESLDDKPVRNEVNKAQIAENTLDTNLIGGNKDGISSKVSFKAPSLKSRRTYLSELRKQDALQRARRSQLARKKETGNSKHSTKKVPSLKAKYHANDLDFTSKSSDNVPTVIIAPCATNEHTLDSCLTAYKINKLKCAISTSPCIKPLEEVSPVLESPCLLSEQRSAIASTSSDSSVSTYSTSTSCVNSPTSCIPGTLSTMSPCSSYTSPIFTQLLTLSQSVGSSSDTIIELMSTSEGKSSTVTLRTMSSQSAVTLIKSPTPVLSSLLACSPATPMSDTVKSAKPKLVGKNKKKNPADKSKEGVKKKRVRVSKKKKEESTLTLPAVNVLRPIISTSNSILPAFNGLGVINAIRSPLPVSFNSSNSPYRQILPKPPFVSLVIRPKIDKVN